MNLDAILAELGPDEVRVLTRLAARLLEGQRRYGRLDVAHDRRDWRAERGDEIADLLVYSAIGELATLDRLDALARNPHLTNPAAQERLARTLNEHEHGPRHGDQEEDPNDDDR